MMPRQIRKKRHSAADVEDGIHRKIMCQKGLGDLKFLPVLEIVS
jgi:hypothetical protein